jgi:hypothetical protein
MTKTPEQQLAEAIRAKDWQAVKAEQKSVLPDEADGCRWRDPPVHPQATVERHNTFRRIAREAYAEAQRFTDFESKTTGLDPYRDGGGNILPRRTEVLRHMVEALDLAYCAGTFQDLD